MVTNVGQQGAPPMESPVDENGGRMSLPWKSWFQRLYAPLGGAILGMPYGQFYDTTTQTAAAATPAVITFNSTTSASGVSRGAVTSRIYAPVAGTYNLAFRLQCENTAAAADNVTAWVKLNGADVAGSAGLSAVAAKHAAINGELILTSNLIMQLAANDYLQLYWMTDGGTSSLVTLAATGSRPQSRCASLSLTFVSR